MKTVHVAEAIIEKDHQILIAKRLKGQHKDLWEFPGGKIEENESSEQALIREIKEELNADISITSYLTTINYTYPDFHLVMDVYLCSLASETMILHDHSQIKWIDPKTQNIDWVPADILVINTYNKQNSLFSAIQ